MVELIDQDLDAKMIDYHPYRHGTNPNHTDGSDSQSLVYLKSGRFYDTNRKEEFCKRITEWLVKYLKSVLEKAGDSSLVVSVAPGHSKDSQTSFLCEILGNVLGKPGFEGVVNGSSYLRRTKDVQKSTDGGIRSIYIHLNSIEVTAPAVVKEKIVCVVDDVWTTGSTLRACAIKMKEAGAKDTKMVAVGKTVQ